MQEINTRAAVFTLLMVGTLVVVAQGIQINAYAAASDTFESEGFVLDEENKNTTGEGNLFNIVRELRENLQDESRENPVSIPVK